MVLGILVRDHISWYPKRYTSDSHVSFRFSPTIFALIRSITISKPRVSLFSNSLNRTPTPFSPRHVVHGSRLLSNDALPTHHDARRRRFRTSAIIASVKHVHYKSLSIDRRSQCFLLHSCVQFSSSFFLSFFSFLTTIFWTRSREKCVSLRRKEAVWEEIDINPNTCFQSLCFNILALIVLSKKNESPFVIDQKKNGITIRDEERNPSPSRC